MIVHVTAYVKLLDGFINSLNPGFAINHCNRNFMIYYVQLGLFNILI